MLSCKSWQFWCNGSEKYFLSHTPYFHCSVKRVHPCIMLYTVFDLICLGGFREEVKKNMKSLQTGEQTEGRMMVNSLLEPSAKIPIE